MKTAIIFYSLSGNTAYVAEVLKEKLGADLIRIRPKKEYPDKGLKKFYFGGKSAVMAEEPELETVTANLSEYDAFILGTPVWAGTFAPPLRTFLKQYGEILKTKELSVYVCCSGGGGSKAISRIGQCLGTESFRQEMILIDPKEKKTPANEAAIQEFCEEITKSV